MSRRKGSMNGKRRGSRIAWILIGVSLFVLIVFPYFGNYLIGLIRSGLTPLQSVGSNLWWIGALLVVVGIGGMIRKSRRSVKILLVGILLIVIGLFLNNPLSLLTEGGSGLGYH